MKVLCSAYPIRVGRSFKVGVAVSVKVRVTVTVMFTVRICC